MIGYNTISCIIAGQILSAVSGGRMTIVVGIVITAMISWIVALFGMTAFQIYERYDQVYPIVCLFAWHRTAPYLSTLSTSPNQCQRK